MINKLIGIIARIAVGKHVVAAVAWAHNKLDGHRSEIALALLATVHALKITGIIPAETADPIEKGLEAIIPVVLADKASKVMATIDSVAKTEEK